MNATTTVTYTCAACGTNDLVGQTVTAAGITGGTNLNGSFVVSAVTGTTVTVGTLATSSVTGATYTGATLTRSGASEVGTTATINTVAAHSLNAGAAFSVSGVTPSGYNGSWTVASVPGTLSLTYSTSPTSGLGVSTVAGSVAAAGSGATESGNTVTLTTTATTSIAQGDAITVTGVGVNGYNGTFAAVAPTGGSTITYTNPTSGLAASGGGTVSVSGATIQVNEASHAAEPAVPFVVKVDNEQMNVVAVSGTGPYTYTVTRGFNGTTAAPHAQNAAVTYPTAKSGCTTDPGVCTIQMQGDVTLTANYVKQWQVTSKVNGIRCDDSFSQLCDLPDTQRLLGEWGTGLPNSIYGAGDLSYSAQNLPQISYVDDGGTLNYGGGYRGIVQTSAAVNSCASGGRGVTVSSSAGFNVGDTILVDGATSLTNSWNGVWTIATGTGNCAFSGTKIAWVDPAGTNPGASINGTLYITDVGNLSQGSNTPSGAGVVFPVYGSADQAIDTAAGQPNTMPPDPNKQYRLLSVQAGNTGGGLSGVNAFGSISNVTQPKTIVVNYMPQHKVRFNQSGLGASDTSGTIAAVQGFGDGGTNQNFTQAQLPTPSTGGTFQDDTKAFLATFTSPVSSVGSPGTTYVAGPKTFSGLTGNQSTADFSSYANEGIYEATYDSNSDTETYYCSEDQGCPFQVGQTVTVGGFVDPLNATLSAALGGASGNTSATVNETNHASEPALPFVAQIDNEHVNVTAVSGTGPYTWTIQRAQDSTSRVAHSAGASVIPSGSLAATLSAGITGSDASISVNEVSHANEPDVPFLAQIDNEQVNVTAVPARRTPSPTQSPAPTTARRRPRTCPGRRW